LKPKLVAPAGSLERLKAAVLYGAGAVYLGGERYGLRAGADNFNLAEITEGASFAHQHSAEVYVVLNAFLHDDDFEGLCDYCRALEEIGVDAVVVSDLGVMRAVKKSSNLPIFLSTQASCLNHAAAVLWRSLGVARVILGREVSIKEACTIKQKAHVALEMFVHGALCMGYAGHCHISTFSAGRDANRGGCIHACRFPYDIAAADEWFMERFFLSSKDLCGLSRIPELVAAGIDALKIEGRMKSVYYVAVTCRVYARALDLALAGRLGPEEIRGLEKDLVSIPHRDYCQGSLSRLAGKESLYFPDSDHASKSTHSFVGLVLKAEQDKVMVRLHAPLKTGDLLEILPFRGPLVKWPVGELFSLAGEPLEEGKQGTIVCLHPPSQAMPLRPNTVLRKPGLWCY